MRLRKILLIGLYLLQISFFYGQDSEAALLDLDRIYSGEFVQETERSIQWIEDGDAFVIIEKSEEVQGADELIRYDSKTQERTVFVSAAALMNTGVSLSVDAFTLSEDASKVLIFTNSKQVWRTKTKGDYFVLDRATDQLTQIGASFEPSSLMFAKISSDNQAVFYVQEHNLYKEELAGNKVVALTEDGTSDIINGTFDWVYEEEFGKRDGFILSPGDDHLAFWQLDASGTGVFYMINTTDSIYSKPIPVQYPKVGQQPSAAKVGLIDLKDNSTHWIPIEGGQREHYIPGMQWVDEDLLLIQQLNRYQNQLIVWSYRPSTKELKKIYIEKEETFIELNYPDESASTWGSNDFPLSNDAKSFLRMTENDAWRHIYKVDVLSGEKTLVTPFDYDVASMRNATKKDIYYIASPQDGTQRYLYQTDLEGKGNQKRLTPKEFSGVNNYDISPNGKYAIHSHQNVSTPRTVRLIRLPDHKTLSTLVDNAAYKRQLKTLYLPDVKFSKITTEEGIEIDVRMIFPDNFDLNKKYPVLFHVYGEPWAQVAKDTHIGLWNIMMAQKGYVIVDMDNRGTPCLKGSAWRKSIYKQVGRINANDQGLAAKEVMKLPFLDPERTSVWGWSGGGTMTLNLMFKFPEIYKTGVAIAAVSNQLVYDNVYQERYMGLPQDDMEPFEKGAPLNYAKNLQGNLLLIHGTADDNVHYQSAELLINELIKQDKQFDMMSYPNRSHAINEGENTTRHLYTLITNYILEHCPVNAAEVPY